MSRENNFPMRTGIYHVKDHIKALELKIHFRQIDSTLNVPDFYLNVDNKTEHFMDSVTTSNSKVVTKAFWQQKILSLNEIELYKNIKNCKTKTEQRYHQQILAWEKANRPNGSDNSAGSKKQKLKKHSKKSQKKQFVDKNLTRIFTYIDEDNFYPKDEKKYLPKDKTKTIVTMYIYAELNPNIQLMVLKWFQKDKMLIVYPDFNKAWDSPYFIEVDTDYRHLYAYVIENVSLRREILFPSIKEQPEIILPVTPLVKKYAAEELKKFPIPKKHTKRIAILFEIVDATGFSNDNIHVRYSVELPEDVLLEEGVLKANTHTASPATVKGKCHFGYNWQLTLLCKRDFNPADVLRIYFVVISYDSWSRERIEGYAYIARHLNAGVDTFEIQCIRPTNSMWENFTQFFIGGRKKFDYKKYFKMESKSNENIYNRYRCLLESTGFLNIKCQRLTQQHFDLLNPGKKLGNGISLVDLMLAHRKAKIRFLAAINAGH